MTLFSHYIFFLLIFQKKNVLLCRHVPTMTNDVMEAASLFFLSSAISCTWPLMPKKPL